MDFTKNTSYNLYQVIIFLLISPNNCLGELIFQEQFNNLDIEEWEPIDKIADCARYFPEKTLSCNRADPWNMRTAMSTLSLTAIPENYFGANFTTATVLSRRSFRMESGDNRTVFQIRASIPTDSGLIPHIFLIPDAPVHFNERHFIISLLKIKNNTFSYDLIDDKRGDIFGKKSIDFNSPSSDQLREFNLYELEFSNNEFIWLFNKQEYFRKSSKLYFEEYFTFYKNWWYPKFKLVFTLEIDQDYHERESKVFRFPPYIYFIHWDCPSLLVDYFGYYNIFGNGIELGKINQTEDYSPSLICDKIWELRRIDASDFKFKDNLLWNDEFLGDKLNETYWLVRGNKDKCEKLFEFEQSCSSLDENSIQIINGTLKLFVKDRQSLGNNFTGVTLVTKMKFRNVRIEISTIRPEGLGVTAALSLFLTTKENQHGETLGHVDIVRFHEDDYMEFRLNYAPGQSHNKFIKGKTDHPDEYSVFAIEWNENYIQWFINEKVIYQANRQMDSGGYSLNLAKQRLDLPFDEEFYLMLHVGAGSFDSEINLDNLNVSLMERPYLEIDFIRVYGNGENSNMTLAIEHEQFSIIHIEDSGLLYYILVPLIIVSIVMTSLFFLAISMWRKQKRKTEQANLELNYDDNDTKGDNIYQEYDYSQVSNENEYENVDENYQQNTDGYYLEIHGDFDQDKEEE